VRWHATVHELLVLPIAGTGIPGFGRKGTLFPSIDNHRSLPLSNPEKCCSFIHHLDCQKHGLDCSDSEKVWIYNKYREAAALLLTFPAAGKSKCPSAAKAD
jgi:hypothetical protein